MIGRWSDTPNGGVILQTDRSTWLARPFDRVGMSTIRAFPSRTAALAYAEAPYGGIR